MTKITNVKGRQVFDSRGNPTVEAEVRRILPNDVDYCALRLVCESGDPKTRLIEYLSKLPKTIKTTENTNFAFYKNSLTRSFRSFRVPDQRYVGPIRTCGVAWARAPSG